MEKETITVIIAVWGALIGSTTFGWNLYRDLTRKGKLRVSCWVGDMVKPGVGVYPNKYLVWQITNIGNEPVVLIHIGGKLNDGKHFMIMMQQAPPVTLKPGDYIIEKDDDLNVLDGNLKVLWAIDSLNRHFKVPYKQIKRLKEEYAAGKYSAEQ